MTASCRSWWGNCAQEADSEMITIDGIEDHIAPISANVSKIRGLISTIELCHHKAERRISNIIEAIGTGETRKGQGTRSPGQQHPVEKVWQNACAALSAWVAGCLSTEVDLSIDTVPASQLLACLGERSPLKEWQVQRVIEKIRSTATMLQSSDDATAQYVWILLNEGENEINSRRQCPDHYKEHEDFWLKTVRTIIHDTEDGAEANLSLGFAIDMLWPCHWRFVENLQIVLEAINGRHIPAKPFAACAWNISLLPIRHRMEIVSNTLKVFCGNPESDQEIDMELLASLGEPTEVKRWLTASLDKTIRLQLDPPFSSEALSALAAPDWIRQ